MSGRRSVDVRYVAVTTFVVMSVAIGVVGSIWAVGRLWRVVSYLLVALFNAVTLERPETATGFVEQGTVPVPRAQVVLISPPLPPAPSSSKVTRPSR